jgi:peptidoglycan/xylan/chitin deacetylase (PgdA/CDA1 family)
VFNSDSRRQASPWPVPLLYKASALVHLAAFVLLLLRLDWWPWAMAALVIDHVVICASSLLPRSQWIGRNVVRLPARAAARGEIALTIDDGPDPAVTPAVLDLLARHGVRASFFCIAERAERHPELMKRLVAEGHEVHNHTARHDHRFSLLGPAAFRREIGSAQATLERLTGARPSCFRAPAGLRNPMLPPVLHELGLTLVSWTRRGYDTREHDPARVLARLLGPGLRSGDILLLHDGNAARDAQGAPVLLAVLPALFEQARLAGLSWVTLGEVVHEAAQSDAGVAATVPGSADALIDPAAARQRARRQYARTYAR